MATALPNVTGPVFHLDPATIATGLAASHASPRKRMILPLHRTQDALVQRIVNFLQPGTYIRPHCHPRPHATETIIVLSGKLQTLVFDPAGKVTRSSSLEAGGVIDIEPNIWHGLVCTAPDTVIVECKRGPYDIKLDKTFAPWSPEESSPETQAYLGRLSAVS